MPYARLFRSRWSALLWAAGILWTAYDVAEWQPHARAVARPHPHAADPWAKAGSVNGDDSADAAPAPTASDPTAGDAATSDAINALVQSGGE